MISAKSTVYHSVAIFWQMTSGAPHLFSSAFLFFCLDLRTISWSLFTGVLWAGVFPIWIGQVTRWTVNANAWSDCKFGYFLFFFSLHYSSVLLAVMCIEKFMALYFPLRVKSFCTVKTAKWVCSIAAFLLAGFDSQFFFAYEARMRNGYFYCTYVNVPSKLQTDFL